MIDIDRILQEVQTHVPEYIDQISLQTIPGGTDPAYGTGKLTALNHGESAFTEPMFPEMEYTNQIIKELGMFRTRLMTLKPYQCYSYHIDPSPRIHIPLITNPNCFMIIDDILYRYPADGNYYVADTTKIHTFVNASTEYRVHIVGGITGLDR
jgi:hypothetical protein